MSTERDDASPRHEWLTGMPWRMHLLIAFLGLTTIGMVVYGFRTGDRIAATHAPLVDAVKEVRIRVATAQLWVEEAVGGDPNVKPETIWSLFDDADAYAVAMLEGGETPDGVCVRLPNARMREEMQDVRKTIAALRRSAEARLAAREDIAAGRRLDERYDTLFLTLLDKIGDVDAQIQDMIAADLRRFQWTQWGLIVVAVLIWGAAGLAFRSFERRRSTALRETHAANEALASEMIRRQQVEREREKLIGKLETQNAELERFAYTVSHDLKSPLITIKGYVGMLQEDLVKGDPSQVEDDLDRISGAADSMNELLADLLELSRIGRLVNPSEDVPLQELAQEAIELVGGQIREAGVVVEIAPDLPVVFGDRIRLREVLQNLIDNAVKYMGAQPNPRIELGTRHDGDRSEYYVRDNGIGIDPCYNERIFGLFDQLDPKAEGSGIGLTLVRRIVEVHGGHVWVESPGRGHGSTFCFTLAPKPSHTCLPANDTLRDEAGVKMG
ncbi:MAG: GHKL domain-containing protein [Pirellulales bacterium]|nr:GHKL domain-containing protein [Pirellulales bacterium]